MSRTKRKIFKREFGDKPKKIFEGGDAQLSYHKGWVGKKRMKPYSSNRTAGKFEPEAYEYNTDGYRKRISKAAKLEAKNANRSMKKGVRQQAKKQIKNELQCGE